MMSISNGELMMKVMSVIFILTGASERRGEQLS